MKRSWICGCAMAVSLAGLTRAEEIQWRAVRSKNAPPVIPVAAQIPLTTLPAPIEIPEVIDANTDVPPAKMPPAPGSSSEIIALPGPAKPENPGPIVCNPLPICDVGSCDPASPVPFIAGTVSAAPIVEAGSCDCGKWSGSWFQGGGSRFWVRGEFLAWWVKSAGVPSLLTTSATELTARDINVGSLGRGDTILLLGGKQLDEQFRPGARFSVGGTLDPCGTRGFDGMVFFTGRRDNRFTATDAQFPFSQLFRPFFAANAGIPFIGNQPGEYREVVALTGLSGRFIAESNSFFWGTDSNFRRNVYRGCNSKLDAFAGFRYLHLDEELSFREDIRVNALIPLIGNVPVGSTMIVRDRFRTENDFYGGQIGFDYEYQQNKWTVGLRSSVAFGDSRERISVAGSQLITIAGQAPQAFNGGLLALNSNIGTRRDNRFAVAPEATMRVGYQMSDRIKLTAGYDFLYWSSVVRPGDQIDRVLDVNRIPNGPLAAPVTQVRPAPLFNTTDFWAQGINVGAEYTW